MRRALLAHGTGLATHTRTVAVTIAPRFMNNVGNYFLGADIYACELDEGAVFLDLRSLKYFAVDAEFLPTLQSEIRSWPHKGTKLPDVGRTTAENASEIIDTLLERGLLATSEPRNRLRQRNVVLPASSQHPDWDSGCGYHITPSLLLHFVACCARAAAAFKLSGFKRMLYQFNNARSSSSSELRDGTPDELRRLLTVFCRLRVWFYTALDACLFDSLALTAFLRRNRIDARLTLGVTLKPFAAHAWVQVGDRVVDDSVEHVREYSPDS